MKTSPFFGHSGHQLASFTIAMMVLLNLLFCTPAIANCQNQDAAEPAVDDSLLPTGRKIQPAGDLISFHGRPVDLAIGSGDRWLFVKDRSDLRIVDRATWKLVQSISSPDGASLLGLAVAADNRVYFTNSKSGIHVFRPRMANDQAIEDPDQETDPLPVADPMPFEFEATIELPADSFPCGIALSEDQETAFVCLSKNNSIAIVDLVKRTVTATIDVGVAPFDVILLDDQQLLVSNIGGRRAVKTDQTAPSAGTPTVVDDRGIASTGTVDLVDLKTRQVIRSVQSGLHPTTLERGLTPQSAVVCQTNEDSVGIIRIDEDRMAIQKFDVKPDPELPFGSMPSDICYLPRLRGYAVALAGNNAVALVEPDFPMLQPSLTGMIPTAWYPTALAVDDHHLYVACTKGLGGRSDQRPANEGRNSHDHLGTIQRIPLEQILDNAHLNRWTSQVKNLSRINEVIEVVESTRGDGSRSPVPIPEKLGDPSVFQHVIYVIKENRTFDQVFGDIPEARSEPSLCVFPERTTPNHHALARRFGVLDNYYCNGVLSADGHSWATEGNVTPYLERAFGGFARSYTFGDDPITYSSSGFIWDHVLAAGLSFRNYGEMDYAKPPEGMEYQAIWKAYQAGETIEFEQNIGIDRLRKYSCRDYPGWNMVIPDVLRMDRFLKEFKQFEKTGGLPNLSIVYLPQDHLGGGVTSHAHMADNDLALGRLVEAVSHSPYWKNTVIFVNEDDPQNGYDHIDGHRSICLVISAYSKPGIHHGFYNQTSVLRTILHLFGLPPLNQQDASMPLMADCFQATPNLAPFEAIPANVPLNQAPPPESKQSATERRWRAILATVPIERTGMKSEQDEYHLNRFVWHEVRGWQTPYPEKWSGSHGKGLKQLGLRIDPDAEED